MGMSWLVIWLVAYALYHKTTSSTDTHQPLGSASLSSPGLSTFNMVTTAFWKPLSNPPQNVSISYYMEYKSSGHSNWTSFHCLSPQWYPDSGELACVFLTCNQTVVDTFYEVRLRAQGPTNSSVSPSTVYFPSDNNVPARITDVRIVAKSPTAMTLYWKLPTHFCIKLSGYCMEIKYYNGTRNLVISTSVSDMAEHHADVTNLVPCFNYSFYVTIYETDVCSTPITSYLVASTTTGPFNVTLSSATITPGVRVVNFDATVHWKYPQHCFDDNSTVFNVWFKEGASLSWQKSNCSTARSNDEFSCLFLTCREVKDEMYQVVVKVGDEQKGTMYFHPLLLNIPNQITNVKVDAHSSKSLTISWELSSLFCFKFPYCIQLCYEEKANILTDEERASQSKVIHNLVPYSTHSFYLETFRPTLGCSFHSQTCGNHSTGPFTARTLEAAPSKPPILLCGLCEVTEGSKRSGTVKWKLPPRSSWNGLPRFFVIEWYVIWPTSSQDDGKVYRKWVYKSLATESHLTELSLYEEYAVRVRMCNDDVGKLCSAFSKEMVVETRYQPVIRTTIQQPPKKNKLALYIALPLTCLVVLAAVLFFIKKRCGIRISISRELPVLSGTFSYENVGFPDDNQYVQLSAKDLTTDAKETHQDDPSETDDRT